MTDYIQSRNEARIVEVVNTLIVNGEIKNPKLSHSLSSPIIPLKVAETINA